MATLVDDLNSLLVIQRGVVEATAAFIDELDRTDPDIADSARDVLETAGWICKGLAHRITQLDGSVTLDVSGMADEMDELADTKAKVELICARQTQSRDLAGEIMRRGDVDGDTSAFLKDAQDGLCDSVSWCESTLDQWKVDM